MRGKILYFSESDGKGIITGIDGNRYDFTENDLRNPLNLRQGTEVDFEIEDKRAIDIYVIQKIPSTIVNNSETIGALGILCFLLPMLGLILYLVWKEEKPKKARGAGTAAIWGCILSFILSFLIAVILVFHIGNMY